ncbi:hypothetical protein BCR36DRAFT_156216 [Piromyces finnis]|uniref:Uncharacterized protein n=1 Tax=Piromyces finnis TaxID=1754191 RepID=A0A1Y1UXA1_9FUNG|nr:hypothetical protein BCR36DRAFT_156216 [Piromyces finnis]|eukprot:ORX42713.1 hypothetical protein BCR36DRAFT_156216 [Piromyces finnis]
MRFIYFKRKSKNLIFHLQEDLINLVRKYNELQIDDEEKKFKFSQSFKDNNDKLITFRYNIGNVVTDNKKKIYKKDEGYSKRCND